jgi:hypothetical protein
MSHRYRYLISLITFRCPFPVLTFFPSYSLFPGPLSILSFPLPYFVLAVTVTPSRRLALPLRSFKFTLSFQRLPTRLIHSIPLRAHVPESNRVVESNYDKMKNEQPMREEGPSLPIPTHLAPRPAQAFGNRRRRRRWVEKLTALQRLHYRRHRHHQRHQQCPSTGIVQALYLISVQRRVSEPLLLQLHPRRVPRVSLRDTRCNRRTFPPIVCPYSVRFLISLPPPSSPSPSSPYSVSVLYVLSCLFGSYPLCGLLRFPFTEGHVESTCVARVNKKHALSQALFS